MAGLRTIHVFIASPGDLVVERRVFKDVIHELNSGFGDGAGVQFVPLGWEDTLAATGRRSQSVINREIDRCDVFILALHRRWGQEAPDAQPYTSYTEEEFHRALDRWNKTGAPEIFVFFKHVDAASIGDPGQQLKKVLEFRKSLEQSRKVFYRFFADEKAFWSDVDKHLRAYAKGEIPKTDNKRDILILPVEYVEEVRKAREEAERQQTLADAALKELKAREAKGRDERELQSEAEAHVALARAEELALLLAEQAAKAALDGRVEEARQLFAKAQVGTVNLRVLFLACSFYLRTGDLADAEEMIQRWLAIVGCDSETAQTANALSNLGLIYHTRGDLDAAEVVLKKSLSIYAKLGDQEAVALPYINLGMFYTTVDDFERAEGMLKKALSIYKTLGDKEGISQCYINLGVMYQKRGDLKRAEAVLKKAVSFEKTLGRQEGMAHAYGNIGMIHLRRGDLKKAERVIKKALAISEKLGDQDGMAHWYNMLGEIYQNWGDTRRAEETITKALVIFEKNGLQIGMAQSYGNLGAMYLLRGEPEAAEQMIKKALVMFESLGLDDAIGRSYSNLGVIYMNRRDLEGAKNMFTKALTLNESLGLQEGMADSSFNLGLIAEAQRDFDPAKKLWSKALQLYSKIGIPERVQETQRLLANLPRGK